MTDDPNPHLVNVQLPSDTVVQIAESCIVMLNAAGEPGKVVPSLVVNTNELGTYRFLLSREVMRSLVDQAEYFGALTAEQMVTIADRLEGTQ